MKPALKHHCLLIDRQITLLIFFGGFAREFDKVPLQQVHCITGPPTKIRLGRIIRNTIILGFYFEEMMKISTLLCSVMQQATAKVTQKGRIVASVRLLLL